MEEQDVSDIVQLLYNDFGIKSVRDVFEENIPEGKRAGTLIGSTIAVAIFLPAWLTLIWMLALGFGIVVSVFADEVC